jgi:hypothetical protein
MMRLRIEEKRTFEAIAAGMGVSAYNAEAAASCRYAPINPQCRSRWSECHEDASVSPRVDRVRPHRLVLGFVWHLLLFADMYRVLAIYTRLDDPIIVLGLTAMIVQGAVLSFAYPFFAAGSTPTKAGVRLGAVFALLFISIAVIAEAAKQRVTSLPTWFLLETAYYVVQFGLVVPPIAVIYSRSSGESVDGLR